MYSLLVKNCRLYDGDSISGKIMDVAVEGDKIVLVSEKIRGEAIKEINAEEKILAPGFIDIQNHSDSYWQLFDNPSLDSLICQGFTTIITGNCGASLAPLLSNQALLSIQKWHNLDGININWQSFAEYISELKKHNYSCNIGSLVGYSTLRRGIVGDQVRGLEPGEMESLKFYLNKSLEEGAFGLSTGLSYAHEIIISEIEIYELAKEVAKSNALFSIHLRNEGTEIIESVEEAIDISRNTNVRLKISHLKIRDQKNWPKFQQLISILETAKHKGINISFDVYPYDTIWQVLYSYLPKWAMEGGRQKVLERIQDEAQKKKILSALNSSDTKISSLFVASTANKVGFHGKSIGQIAKNMESSSEQALLNIIQNGGSEILVFEKNLDQNQVQNLVAHPLSIIATDGGGFPLENNTNLYHPRCFGTSFKVFEKYVKSGKLSLDLAIKKMSSYPASVVGLKKRGMIKVGYFADMVLIDMEKISDLSTYENPFQAGIGIEKVFVNGRIAAEDGKTAETKNGYILTRK